MKSNGTSTKHLFIVYRHIWFLILLWGLLLLGGCQSQDGQSEEQPNFILFFTDELQFSDLGCYGGTIPTPHLDQLAAAGMLFKRAYTPASMCTPSRYAVLTGQFPGRCQSPSFLHNNPRTEPYSIAWNTWLTREKETLPDILRKNGYFTGMSGKWHVGKVPDTQRMPTFKKADDPADPEVQEKLAEQQAIYCNLVKEDGGFDYAASVVWSNFDGHPVEALRFHNFPWITYGAVRFLETASKLSQPFFLYFTPTAIHGPNHVADLEKDVTLTPSGGSEEVLPFQIDRTELKSALQSVPKKTTHRYAGISQIDHQLGLLREQLERLKLHTNTIILFLSDHNIEPGKATSFEKGIHIPMIAYWPKKDLSRETAALVQNTDLLPTILELAGIESPTDGQFDGRSLVPILRDSSVAVRKHVFAENGYTRSVSDGRYKYIALRYPDTLIAEMESGNIAHVPSYVKTWPQAHSAIAIQAFPAYFDQDQLYDLTKDPYELNNLADSPEYADILKQLKGALGGHLKTFDHPYSLEKQPFLETVKYQELQAINRAYDIYSIPWLSRDHGGIAWPPIAKARIAD